jgi:hypothetical protein
MEKTAETGQTPLARSEELVVQELPDEVLVYDLTRHKAHCLNKTSAFIWNHCDGQRTADEIAKLMQKEWNTPVSEDTVWFALDKLGKADLLHQRVVLPQARAGMSRRSAIRRLGLGALLVPVVMTIVSPTALAGASVVIPPQCQSCVKQLDSSPCPPQCGPSVPGTCYGNNGCGAGNFSGCFTCAQCKAKAVSPLSWVGHNPPC